MCIILHSLHCFSASRRKVTDCYSPSALDLAGFHISSSASSRRLASCEKSASFSNLSNSHHTFTRSNWSSSLSPAAVTRQFRSFSSAGSENGRSEDHTPVSSGHVQLMSSGGRAVRSLAVQTAAQLAKQQSTIAQPDQTESSASEKHHYGAKPVCLASGRKLQTSAVGASPLRIENTGSQTQTRTRTF